MMTYTLTTLRAVKRGLEQGQSMYVTATNNAGRLIIGLVVGMGSKLAVQDEDCGLVEDIPAEQVRYVWVKN